MATFDGWDTRYCGDALALPGGRISGDVLMHFRTRGSKNGIRRFQEPDGTWTPLGLKERQKREGWGDSRAERKAERSVARAERKAARAERKAQRTAAVKDRIMGKKKASKNDLSKLSDEELRKKIERVKMELEYKELTKSPVVKFGEKAVTAFLENSAKRADRIAEKEKRAIDMKRIEADIVKAKEGTKKAAEEAKKAESDAQKTASEWGSKAKELEQRTALKRAKIDWKGTTVHGGVARRINAILTSGVSKKMEKIRITEGEIEAAKKMKAYRDSEKNKADRTAAAASSKQARADAKRARVDAKRQKAEEIRRREASFDQWENRRKAAESYANFKQKLAKEGISSTLDVARAARDRNRRRRG